MEFPYHIPLPVALAVIAAIGYMVGRGSRARAAQEADKARRELRRAKVIAKELEQIAEEVRKHLATHHLNVAKFKERVTQLGSHDKDAAWQNLCSEAEADLEAHAAAGRADRPGLRRNSPANQPVDDL